MCSPCPTDQFPRMLRQTHCPGCMTQRSGPWITLPYSWPLAWWHQWCGSWTQTLSVYYVQSPLLSSVQLGVCTFRLLFSDRLICWAHTSPSFGHPGIGRNVRSLSGKYWCWFLLLGVHPVQGSQAPVQREVTTPTHSTTAVVAPVGGLPDRSSSLTG
jgi:hypothetical protein